MDDDGNPGLLPRQISKQISIHDPHSPCPTGQAIGTRRHPTPRPDGFPPGSIADPSPLSQTAKGGQAY